MQVKFVKDTHLAESTARAFFSYTFAASTSFCAASYSVIANVNLAPGRKDREKKPLIIAQDETRLENAAQAILLSEESGEEQEKQREEEQEEDQREEEDEEELEREGADESAEEERDEDRRELDTEEREREETRLKGRQLVKVKKPKRKSR